MNKKSAKNEKTSRLKAIDRRVMISSIVFGFATIIHMYFFQDNWSFITSFFSANPMPWIMLAFVAMIVYFFFATYAYFRKHL